jgi:hypothetical protein
MRNNNLQCDECGNGIKGRYQINIWEQNCCLNCYRVGMCGYCGGGGGKRRGQSEIMCTTCHRLAVTDAENAARLYREVAAWMVRRQFFAFTPMLPITLSPQDRIHFPDRQESSTLGVTTTIVTTTARAKYVRAEGITLAYGMPSPLFQMVLAHELGHVWISQNGIIHLDLQDEEGFCELVSHLWVGENAFFGRSGLLKGIETSTDPIYGDGFRKMFAVKERNGLAGLIALLKQRVRTEMFRR